MKFRGLVLATIVLALLIGLLYWSNREPAAKPAENSDSTSPKILALNQADIVKIDVKKKNGDEVAVAKDSSGAWHITAPATYRADPSAINGILSDLSPLTADQLVEDKATNLANYGLSPPDAEVTVTESGDKSQRLLLGDETPTHSGAYAALAGDPRVFTISSYVKTGLEKNLNDLRDKNLFDLGFSDPQKIEFHDGDKTYFLTRGGTDWWGAYGKKLESAGANSFVEQLRNLKAEKFVDSGFGAPTIQITVIADPGGQPQKVSISQSGDQYIAKREGDSTLYQLDGKAVEELQKAEAKLK
jgi:hypothetical protein